MSDEAPDTSAGSLPRERAGCVLGIALGLLVLLGLVAAMATQKTRLADGQEWLAEWFELAPEPSDGLPFGLRVEAASVGAGGEQVVLLAPDEVPEEAPKAERPEPDKSSRKSKEKFSERSEPEPAYDWSKIPIGPAGTPPVEVVIVRYPAGRAEGRLDDLFGFRAQDDDEVEITDVDADGGEVVMDRGRVNWGPYSTSFVHARELEWGGTFRDVLRVNLTLPGRATVAFMRWPRGLPASLERVRELLVALGPPSESAPESPPESESEPAPAND